MSAQIYDINYFYNKSSNPVVDVKNTEMGDFVIDAAGNKLVTHLNEFKFMQISDTYNNPSADVALSTLGALSMISYSNNNEIMSGVTNIKSAIDRLVEILSEKTILEGLTSDYVSVEIIKNPEFYKNVETEITFKITISNYPYEINSVKFGEEGNYEELLTTVESYPAYYGSLDTKVITNTVINAYEEKVIEKTITVKLSTDLLKNIIVSTDYLTKKGEAPDPNSVTISVTAKAIDLPAFSANAVVSPTTFEKGENTDVTYTLTIPAYSVEIPSITVDGVEITDLPVINLAYTKKIVKTISDTTSTTFVITLLDGTKKTYKATATAIQSNIAYAWIAPASEIEIADADSFAGTDSIGGTADDSASALTYNGTGEYGETNYSVITTDNTFMSSSSVPLNVTFTKDLVSEKSDTINGYYTFFALPVNVDFVKDSTYNSDKSKGIVTAIGTSNAIYNYGEITINGKLMYLYRTYYASVPSGTDYTVELNY